MYVLSARLHMPFKSENKEKKGLPEVPFFVYNLS